MKKIKIKILDSNDLKFQILEDASKGDYFSLKDLEEIDFSNLNDFISQKQKKLIFEESKKAADYAVLKFKNSSEYNSLKKFKVENDLLIKKINEDKILIEENAKNEAKSKYIEKISKKEEENKFLNIKIKELEEKFNHEKKILKEKYDLEHINSINENINSFNEKINALKIEKIELKNNYENKINEIKREKTNNSKLIGENLENWILEQYNNYFNVLVDDSELKKANEIIEGTKPDFIFTTYDNNDKSKLVSITIEAKSQAFFSNNSKKNKDFFEKLEKDKHKNKTEFALLVSELELDKNFSIIKVKEYENMYVIRPEYFISFISIVRSIALKRKEINQNILNFKEKQKIIEEFEKEKTDIINNSLKNLQSNLNEISKQANIILTSANKILESKRIASDSHVNTIKNKIENFSFIKSKKLNEIDQINRFEKNLKSQSQEISKDVSDDKDFKH